MEKPISHPCVFAPAVSYAWKSFLFPSPQTTHLLRSPSRGPPLNEVFPWGRARGNIIPKGKPHWFGTRLAWVWISSSPFMSCVTPWASYLNLQSLISPSAELWGFSGVFAILPGSTAQWSTWEGIRWCWDVSLQPTENWSLGSWPLAKSGLLSLPDYITGLFSFFQMSSDVKKIGKHWKNILKYVAHSRCSVNVCALPSCPLPLLSKPLLQHLIAQLYTQDWM